MTYDAPVVSVEPGRGDGAGPIATLQGGADGDVNVLFQDFETGRTVSMSARSVVVFLRDDAAAERAGGTFAADGVRGVYLEGGSVITDGDYTVRSPRAFYDLSLDRAVLLDAVVYTYDARNRVPLYMRAEVLEQLSATSWAARDARFTTSEFAKPHLAIGASRLAVRAVEDAAGRPGVAFEAEGTTLRVGDTPLFYWPRVAGTGFDLPLRSLRVGYRSTSGPVVQTDWDLFALLGREAPEGVDADLEIDYRGEHGPALGIDAELDRGDTRATLDAYALLHDSGDDDLGTRGDIEFDGEFRGYARASLAHAFDNGWTLAGRAAHASDPTLLEEFTSDLAEQSRAFDSQIVLARADRDRLLFVEARDNLNTFTPSLSVLQTPGYVTAELPAVGFRQIGSPLLAAADGGGRLVYRSDTSAAAVRANFGSDAPEDRGFSDAQSLAVFGFAAATAFDDAAEAAGLPTDTVLRVDTRHELSLPLDFGSAASLAPYAVGRFTAWDADPTPGPDRDDTDDDRTRTRGAVGVRGSIRFAKTDADAASRLLDLDGLRHIVEPAFDVAWHTSSLDEADLFVWDPDIESLAEGGVFRVGVRQTFQTRRGRGARQRTVDWLLWDTFVVFREDAGEAEPARPLPRYVAWRPELTRGGDHAHTEMRWQATEIFGVAGELTYGFEDDAVAQWRLGLTLDHSPRLQSTLGYEEIDALDSSLLTYSLDYQLTRKYRFRASQTLDFSGNERRTLGLGLERRLPRMRIVASAAFDQLNDEQTFGLTLIPDGLGGSRGLGTGLLQ